MRSFGPHLAMESLVPLIPQQDIIVIQDLGGTSVTAAEKLRTRLEEYPPSRIVAISVKNSSVIFGTELVAVIETI